MTWRTVGLESRLEKSLDIVKVDEDDDDDENDRFGDGWIGDGAGNGWGEGADPECDITYGNSDGDGITFGYGDSVPYKDGDGVSSK
jgi:hypothetical protein